MYNAFEFESSIFKELILFYHFAMGFNLLNHILGKYEILCNRFYGFAKHIFKTWLGFVWSVCLLLLFKHEYMYAGDNCSVDI